MKINFTDCIADIQVSGVRITAPIPALCIFENPCGECWLWVNGTAMAQIGRDDAEEIRKQMAAHLDYLGWMAMESGK